MKKTNLIKILVVFIVLVFGAVIIYIAKHKPKGKGILPNIKKDDIQKITILNKEKTLTFSKDKNIWKITSPFVYKVDENKFDKFLSQFIKLRIENLISTNPKKKEKFGLKKEEAIKIEVFLKKRKTVSFLVGKMSADYIHFYLSYPDKNEIYLASGIERYKLTQQADNFRDKTVFSLNSKDVKEINIDGKERYNFFKKDDSWKAIVNKKEKNVNKDKWNEFLTSICKLKTDGFYTEKEKDFGWENPTLKIEIKLNNEQTHTLLIGNKHNTYQYYVKKNEDKTVFLFNQTKINNLSEKPKLAIHN